MDYTLRVCGLGDLEHLLAYESDRQRRVVPMMGGVDCLNRLYSNRITPVVLLRNLGCHLAHSLQPVKVHGYYMIIIFKASSTSPISALVGHQEGHLVCKNLDTSREFF